MKKWLIRFGIGVGVMLLVTGGVTFAFHLRGKAQLAEKIAELKAQGLPTTFAELEAKYKLPEGTPNAADIYMKAFAAYKSLADEKQKLLPVMGDQSEPNANEPYPPERITVAAEFVEQNQEMLELLHAAGQIENAYYVPESCRDILDKGLTYQEIKKGCHSLRIAMIYYLQTGQHLKAYAAWMDQLNLGRSLLKCPFMIGNLVQKATIAMSISDLERLINQSQPEETQLLQMQNKFLWINEASGFGNAIEDEICFCLEYPRTDPNFPTRAEDVLMQTIGLMPYETITLIDTYQKIIAIDKLPIEERVERLHDAIRGVHFMHLSCMTTLPMIEKVLEIHLRVQAQVDCAITAIAIERYRLKEGKLPETVEALVPDYLSQVYVDPFDGNPLRYKQMDTGYMIYTIGSDGVDNGGRERGPNERGENQDWVFRVYR